MKNIRTILRGGLFVGLLSILNACYYDEVVPIEAPVADVGEVLFSETIMPIFNAKCNTSGCHNGTVAPDLRPDKAHNALMSGNYINKSDPKSSELYQWMAGKRKMPMPLSGPVATDNAKVLKWIEQGGLNN